MQVTDLEYSVSELLNFSAVKFKPWKIGCENYGSDPLDSINYERMNTSSCYLVTPSPIKPGYYMQVAEWLRQLPEKSELIHLITSHVKSVTVIQQCLKPKDSRVIL